MLDELSTFLDDHEVIACRPQLLGDARAQREGHRELDELDTLSQHGGLVEAEQQQCLFELGEDSARCSQADPGALRPDGHPVELVGVAVASGCLEPLGGHHWLPYERGRREQIARDSRVHQALWEDGIEGTADRRRPLGVSDDRDELEGDGRSREARHLDGVMTELDHLGEVAREEHRDPELGEEALAGAGQRG